MGQQSLGTMVKDGQDYMKTWPVKKELFALFPECRVVAATKFSLKAMPAVAVMASALMINVLGNDYIPQAIAIFAFFMSLPLQGLIWLGHRSNQVLPPQLKHWYQDIHRKMSAEGCQVQAMKSKPQYKELAKLLKTAFEELDRVFTRNWF